MIKNRAVAQLKKELGEHLQGLIIYPRWVERISPIDQQTDDYLFLVDAQISWLEIRMIYRAFSDWEIVPLILPVATWQQLVQLNPAWGYHVALFGRVWHGKIDLWQWQKPALIERLAPLTTAVIEASSLLMGHLLLDEKKEKAIARLKQLQQLLYGQTVMSGEWEAVFAKVEAALIERIALLKLEIAVVEANADAPLLLPELVAICQQGIDLLLVLDEKRFSSIVGMVNWQEVGDLLAADYEGVGIGTAAQLWLSIMEDRAATVILRGFQQQWGTELLDGKMPERANVLRDAARLAVAIIPAMSRDYLTYAEDQMGVLIHDYQNNLLNVQLEHELLHRLLGIPRAEPEPLPGKEESVAVRIAAIFDQAAWWGNYYMALMDDETA